MKIKKYLTTLLIVSSLTTSINLSAENIHKNYVNQCSDPGFGGCPTIRTPYQTPKSNQLTPNPQPILVPKMMPILQPRMIIAPDQNKGIVHNYHNIPELQKAPEKMPINEPKIVEQQIPGFAKTIGAPGDIQNPGEPIPMVKKEENPKIGETYIVPNPKIINKEHFGKIYHKVIKNERKTFIKKDVKSNFTKIIPIKTHSTIIKNNDFKFVRGASRNNINNSNYMIGGLFFWMLVIIIVLLFIK